MIREYYLEKDQARIDAFLEAFKTPEDVKASTLQRFFSHNPKKDSNGKIVGVTEPLYYTSDEFLLPKGTLINQKEAIETTYGLYIFNLKCISPVFKEIIPYVNYALDDKNLKDLLQQVASLLTVNKITGEQFAEFQNNFYFLSYKATLYLPGTNLDMIRPNPKVIAYKKKLLKENAEFLDPSKPDYAEQFIIRIENPLLDYAKEILKDNPGYLLYKRGGKPKFGNVYKNIAIGVGPIYDPINDKFSLQTEALNEGLPNEMTNIFANILVASSYFRAIATADGGTKTKYIFSAMQSVVFDKKDSDCHTKLYDLRLLTEGNIKDNLYRFIIDDTKKALIRLNPENAKEYIGKVVKLRSPLYCKNPKYCNICSGDYLFELGIKNVGNTATKISSTLMNKALKNMHDVTLKTSNIDIFKYILNV
jgi:hypothetical protein